MLDRERYLRELSARRSRSRVRTRHQLIGLLIAETLQDRPHKSLYIRMAKEGDPDTLLALAKDVAARGDVEHPGAYFMTAAHERGYIPFTHPDEPDIPAR